MSSVYARDTRKERPTLPLMPIAKCSKFCYNNIGKLTYNKTVMAKKRKIKKKAAALKGPEHKLPAGFWQQVVALGLIAVSILLIVAWFGVGGPVLEQAQKTALEFIGYAVYAIPLLFCYVGVEIFRADENKLPFIMKVATGLVLVWLAGLFGLLEGTPSHGGWVGENLNNLMLSLVEKPIAAFIYVLLTFFTIL